MQHERAPNQAAIIGIVQAEEFHRAVTLPKRMLSMNGRVALLRLSRARPVRRKTIPLIFESCSRTVRRSTPPPRPAQTEDDQTQCH